MKTKSFRKDARGTAMVEMAIAATVFLTAMFAVVEFGRFLWTHNALKSAVQRGARYATLRKSDSASQLAVKKMVVYGDPNANPATAKPVVGGLTTANVSVAYKNYNGIELSSQATVTVVNYKFKFAVPLVGTSVTLPPYRTALPGESAGYVPCDIGSANPQAPCSIIPN